MANEVLSDIEIAHVADVIENKIIPVIGPFARIMYEKSRAAVASNLMQGGDNEPNSGNKTSTVDLQITGTARTLWVPECPNFPLLAEDFEDPLLKNLSPEEIMKLPGVLVLDGADGTGMMLRLSKIFSNSFGFMSYGKIVLGIVHRPIGNRTWIAQKGVEGSFRDRQRMQLSTVTNLGEAIGSTAYAWDREPDGARDQNLALLNIMGLLMSQPGFNRASSVLDIIKVAEGQNDLHISYGLKPWDVGAAPFMVTHQGGFVTTDEGKDWNIFSRSTIVANNKQLLDQALMAIAGAKKVINEERMLKELLAESRQDISQLQKEIDKLRRWRGLGAVVDSAISSTPILRSKTE